MFEVAAMEGRPPNVSPFVCARARICRTMRVDSRACITVWMLIREVMSERESVCVIQIYAYDASM